MWLEVIDNETDVRIFYKNKKFVFKPPLTLCDAFFNSMEKFL